MCVSRLLHFFFVFFQNLKNIPPLEELKKKILYRSVYRGTKEMDLLLSNFVKKYINEFSIAELKQLNDLLNFGDDDIFKWYLNKNSKIKIPENKVTNLLKKFKFK